MPLSQFSPSVDDIFRETAWQGPDSDGKKKNDTTEGLLLIRTSCDEPKNDRLREALGCHPRRKWGNNRKPHKVACGYFYAYVSKPPND